MAEGPVDGSLEQDLRAAARAEFAALAQGPDQDLALDLAAAWLAAEEQPGVDAATIVGSLDQLAAGLRVPSGADVFQQTARLVHHLFVDLGFQGDDQDYDSPRNSYLDQVLERRRGLPILLSLVMIEVGRRVGVAIDGIGFPGHFLVKPHDADPPFYVDPFHRGRIVRQAELEVQLNDMGSLSAGQAGAWLAPVTSRQLLLRVNHNLKQAFIQRRDVRGVLRAVERLLLLDPRLLDERRDRALLLGQLGRNRSAASELRAYLAQRPDGQEAEQLRRHLAKLSARAAHDHDESDD